MTANVKQRILEKTIAALDPRKDGETIARLQSELRTMASPVPAPEPSETPVGVGNGGQESQLTEKDVDDYRANGPTEVSLQTKWGMVYLVKEKTGADRFELLPEDIVKIQTARRLFGADVVDLAFKGKTLEGKPSEIEKQEKQGRYETENPGNGENPVQDNLAGDLEKKNGQQNGQQNRQQMQLLEDQDEPPF